MISLSALIMLAILCVIVGFVAWALIQLLALVPMQAPFQAIARGAIILVAVLIILYKLLPMLGVG